MLNAITHNFRLMAAEVKTMIERASIMVLGREAEKIDEQWDSLENRRAYISTLADLIQNKTFSLLIAVRRPDKDQTRALRAMSTISGHLNVLVDLAFNLARQIPYLSRPRLVDDYDLGRFFPVIISGLERLEPAWDHKDIDLAFSLGRTEAKLDELYAEVFKKVLANLEHSPAEAPPGDLVTILMMAHYLERMGDRLLNVGESVIYYLVGEQLKFSQYLALSDGLNRLGRAGALTAVTLEPIWGGRSGCRLGVVADASLKPAEPAMLFKSGRARKVARERENISLWESLAPGLPPQVKAYTQEGRGGREEAAMVMQFLPGQTLKDLALGPPSAFFADGLKLALTIMGQVWERTRTERPARAGFVAQSLRRLPSVVAMHEKLLPRSGHLGALRLYSMKEILSGARFLDEELLAPFSVRIHGDFNLSNIIYDPRNERLNLIDLYRSDQSDYLQDISVLLASLFRLPVFGHDVRRRLEKASDEVYAFGRDFAKAQNDPFFTARLALALARSFLTSTRFELRRSFVRQMLARSAYLFRKLLDHRAAGADWASFELRAQILYL